MIVSEMNLSSMSEHDIKAWHEELVEAYDYIVEEFGLTAPQLHDALTSLELGRCVDGSLPTEALKKMHHSEIGHVDFSWLEGTVSAELKRDEDGSRYLLVDDMKLSPLGGGYWSVERIAGNRLELLAAWVASDSVRKIVANKGVS